MNAPKFLKFFFNNVLITFIILLICIGASLYYLFLPDDTKLTLRGYEFPIPIVIFILGIVTEYSY